MWPAFRQATYLKKLLFYIKYNDGGHIMPSLVSDTSVAIQHSNNLKNSAKQLGTINNVDAGETNHAINSSCCNYYNDILSILQSYSTAAEGDAERIKTIDSNFASVDSGMASKI